MSKIIKFVLGAVVIIALVVIVGFTFKGKKEPGQGRGNDKETAKGISLSPKSFQSADFIDFFQKAKETGSIVSWAGDWQELSNLTSGGATVVASLSKTYNYTPVIQAQFFTQSSGKLLRPLDNVGKENYKVGAAAFAEKFKPKYLGLGIEINTLYEKSPADFEAFANFFSEVYNAVKAKSPDTKVFTVFQLEKMKGLRGGLFGGKNDASKNQWALLDKFPKSDIAVFTTYPGLIYKNPSEIPADYYTEIKSHTAKPLAFSEVGWHAAASPAGWESSDSEQAEFIKTFFSLSQGINKEFVIWSFMYDPDTFEPFNSMGLRKKDGTARPAWQEWLSGK